MRQYCNETGEDVTNFSARLGFYGFQFFFLPFVALFSFYVWNPRAYSLFFSVDTSIAISFFAIALGFVLLGSVWLGILLFASQTIDEEMFVSRMNHLYVLQLLTFLPATVLFILPVILEMLMHLVLI